MTYLEIINSVLRNLREDEAATSTESAYTKLIGFFVKQAYIECSNAYQWPQLDETQDIAVTAADESFSITSDSGEGVHQIYSVFNTNDEVFLRRSNPKWITDSISSEPDQETPQYYAYGGETADGTTIHIYPPSDGSYTLRVSYNRKPDLNNTFSDSTFIKLPEMPIILKAWARAVSERGEDGGMNSNELEVQAQMALSDAIALHESNNNTDNMRWDVV